MGQKSYRDISERGLITAGGGSRSREIRRWREAAVLMGCMFTASLKWR